MSLSLGVGNSGPLLLYGTAYKKAKTAELTESALKHGFRGIDTANYPTAYDEPLTGDGIQSALQSGIAREDIFLQSKFTPLWAHDKDKVPFNPDQEIEGQVHESIRLTLEHLRVEYLDAFLLHAPYPDEADNLRAWKVFETYVPHKIRRLGVSNMNLPQLRTIWDTAAVKPVIVQNRFYRTTGYDIELRAYCADRGIAYQAFYTLGHNPELLGSKVVADAAGEVRVEKEVAFYLLVLLLGGTQILDGTTRVEAMDADLAAVRDVLGNEENVRALQPSVAAFKGLITKLAREPDD